ncbi:glycosyltransferase family 39 protein [Xenorhabdus szentirmaii]|uniref:glycosyltransferase family 39 protein n=1 Tax=Xenorhabdus szentirmaii TaxID=290112 RepID=UPI00198CCC8C|nr:MULTISPECIES: glycosyltransferase family 39 protein [unclassified Xenorhabdus]MBD2780305.1 glycosyltransferase family 39 protein [Xenorhabdus sp. 38]MBD2804854.1 glycosyltransferase family 39 protein [Xenorhabdus sp. ZM]
MRFFDTSSYRMPLCLWITGYAVLWIMASYSLDPTVPYDAVEALNWGINGEWGSPKNPWLVGAIMLPAIHISNISLSFYWYFTHFVAIALGMLGVWKLAFRLTGKVTLAWLAMLTLNLSGIINFDIIPYNDNYLLVMLWPWSLLFFLHAIDDSPKWWLAFALTTGLATMGKYSSLSIIGSVFLLSLFVPKVRRHYREPLFYLAITLWLALVLPNLGWLVQNDFVAFKWVDSQIQQGFNLHTTRAVLSVFYPLIIVSVMIYLLGGRIGWPEQQSNALVNIVILLPLLIIYGWFSFNQGGRMTEWVQPFMTVAPALLVGSITVYPQKSLRGALRGLALFGVLVLVGYTGVMMANVRDAGQKFVGIKTFTGQLDQRWNALYSTPLRYVGGEYLHQWLTFYSRYRPETIQPWTLNAEMPPNIYNSHVKEKEIVEYGALLVGERGKSCQEENFRHILQDWPALTISHKEAFSFQSQPSAKSDIVCIGFVAPETHQ